MAVLSVLLSLVGALLIGLAIAHLSPWLALAYAGLVFIGAGELLDRGAD